MSRVEIDVVFEIVDRTPRPYIRRGANEFELPCAISMRMPALCCCPRPARFRHRGYRHRVTTATSTEQV